MSAYISSSFSLFLLCGYLLCIKFLLCFSSMFYLPGNLVITLYKPSYRRTRMCIIVRLWVKSRTTLDWIQTRTESQIPKFLVIFLEIVLTWVIHAHLHVLYCNCVKFYQSQFILEGGVSFISISSSMKEELVLSVSVHRWRRSKFYQYQFIREGGVSFICISSSVKEELVLSVSVHPWRRS